MGGCWCVKEAQEAHFDGSSYEPGEDFERLTSQLEKVRDLMLDGHWRSPQEIVGILHCGSDSAITARLRDLRKKRFGGFEVECMRVNKGLFRYRVY